MQTTRDAVVVFSRAPTQHPLDWVLRGFKHVHVAVPAETGEWVHVEMVDGQPLFRVVAGEVDLETWFQELGNVVLRARSHGGVLAPLVVRNCVGMTKTVLGVRAWWVQTPDQLYRYLRAAHDSSRVHAKAGASTGSGGHHQGGSGSAA